MEKIMKSVFGKHELSCFQCGSLATLSGKVQKDV